MSSVRSGLKLRVILYTQIEPVTRNLHFFNKRIIRSSTCKARTALYKSFPVVVINFVSVSVTFLDFIFAIALVKEAVRSDLTRVCTKS